jgi:hypothetical protein
VVSGRSFWALILIGPMKNSAIGVQLFATHGSVFALVCADRAFNLSRSSGIVSRRPALRVLALAVRRR